MSTINSVFHKIVPGERIPGDWYAGKIPINIEVGKNSVIDSSFCFKHYFSILSPGLIIGPDVTIWRASLAAEENGSIEIGPSSYIANASLVCSERIRIGARVLIAGGVTIADSDFHPIDPALRIADTIALSTVGNRHSRPNISTNPVIIGDDVWIGYNATILKGVHVGNGAVIAPGSVVIQNVPPNTTVMGNPAKPINQDP